MSDVFMCMECNENCHGKMEEFTVCNACREGWLAEIDRLRDDVTTWKEKARYCATEVLNDWELGRLSVDSKQAAEFIIAALRKDEG